MGDELETREKLLESAMAEFSEKWLYEGFSEKNMR